MSNVLCIAGMHRSGTSLTASWLKKCGLNVDAGSVVAPSPWNSKGHFEDRDLVRLHEDAINALKPKAQGWKLYQAKHLSFQEPQLRRAKELISSRSQISGAWGWKDPRATHFLQQWKELIPGLRALIVWRPAASVVASLVKRAVEKRATGKPNILQIGTINAVRLWLSHNRLLHEFQQRYPNDTVLLPLTVLSRRDRDVVNLIRERLAIDLDYVPFDSVFEQRLLSDPESLKFPVSLIEDIPSVSFLKAKLLDASDFSMSI